MKRPPKKPHVWVVEVKANSRWHPAGGRLSYLKKNAQGDIDNLWKPNNPLQVFRAAKYVRAEKCQRRR